MLGALPLTPCGALQGYELTKAGDCTPAAPATQPDFEDHMFLPFAAPAQRAQRTLFGRLVDALQARAGSSALLPAGLLPAGPPSPDPRAYLHPPPHPSADSAPAPAEAASEAESIAMMVRAGEEDADRGSEAAPGGGQRQTAAQEAAGLESSDPVPGQAVGAPADADWQRRWGWLAWASAGSADAVALAAQAALPRDDGDAIWRTQVPCARALKGCCEGSRCFA